VRRTQCKRITCWYVHPIEPICDIVGADARVTRFPRRRRIHRHRIHRRNYSAGAGAYHRGSPMSSIYWGIAWGALATLGGILVAAARTEPEAAISNLAKWATWCGIRAPNWLANRSADYWARRIGAGIALASAVLVVVWVYDLSSASAQATSGSGITVGKESTVVGTVPPNSVIGDKSTIVRPSDSSTNTIYNQGGTAIGHCAYADSSSVAIGAGAGVGMNPSKAPECK
jgi:hypothetical protein